MEVRVDDVSFGSFGPGESVDFSIFPGGGVTESTVLGIEPPADTDDVHGFPLHVSFDATPTSFTMTSINANNLPALPPGGAWALALLLSLTAGLVLRARK